MDSTYGVEEVEPVFPFWVVVWLVCMEMALEFWVHFRQVLAEILSSCCLTLLNAVHPDCRSGVLVGWYPVTHCQDDERVLEGAYTFRM